jgi:hypothetical protein
MRYKGTMDNDSSTKSPRLERLEAELKEWGLDLEKFTARARQAAGGGVRVGEWKRAGTESAKEMEKGLENAWGELKKAFDLAATKFKQGS